MDNKIIILGIMILVIFLSGCIQSDTSKIDGVSTSINTHLKNGDNNFNNAGTDVNKFLYTKALKESDNASSEFNQAKSLASQGFTYAQNSNDTVYVNYMQLVLNEIDAKINATNELKTAIPYLMDNDTINANTHVSNANGFMNKATTFYDQRQDIVKQNPTKFK
jgi:outer membrane murein-binding lipoprotein Lpp